MTVVPVPCLTQTAPSLAPAHLHSPPAGGTGGVTHFADGEIEAQSSHSSTWQGQGPELCVSLSLPRAPRTRCEGEAGWPPPPPRAHLGREAMLWAVSREAQLLNGGSPPGLGCSEGAHCCAA